MATRGATDVNFEKFDFDRVANDSSYIDKGAFGEVYGPFTWNRRESALKRTRISAGRPGEDFKMQVKDKISIWTSVKHKNLIEIHNVILRPKALYIVMEYASGGSLRGMLDNPDAAVHRQIVASSWVTQIANGMLYLHEKNIVHRDLKSNNIMLMTPFDHVDPRKEMTLKITDFDDVREHKHTTTMSLRGTVAYTAPEVLRTERFSKTSDVWSFGVVVWEMLTGKLPHEDAVVGAIMVKAINGELTLSAPESIRKAYKELLRDCLHQNKESRPSFEGIIVLLKEDKFRSEYKSDPVLASMIRTKVAEVENKSIYGLAILDRELFVVSEKSSQVEVYDSMNLRFSRLWKLSILIDPWDIGSCNKNKCLYIFDYRGPWKSNEILRVDPKGKLINNWSTGDDHGFGLSVTEKSHIILTVIDKHKLNEYSPDGKLIREINLSDADIRYPWHAIELTNGHFVVSHGYDDGDDELRSRRVCKVDGDGKLKKSFDGKYGTTTGQMNRPGYLAVDGNGFVLVADRWNSRVLLLNSELELKREILSKERKQGLRHPATILLDELNGRLFVADNESTSRRIVIFDF